MMFSERVRLDPTRKLQADLQLLGDRVSRLWNAANYLCRQRFLAKEGVPTGPGLEEAMQDTPDYRHLPSDIAQEVLKKLSESWKSYFSLRKRWTQDPAKCQKPGLPAYRKDRKTGSRPSNLIPIKHPRSYALDRKDAHIVLPRDQRAKHTHGRLHISYRGRMRYSGKKGRAEITFDEVRKRWYLTWTVKTADPAKLDTGRSAAVDLGVRISASLSIEGLSKALHFEAREVLKDWDWFGKAIAREQQALAGTRGKIREDRAPSSRNISMLHRKRADRLRHAQQVLAKEIARTCDEHGVDSVYLGYPKNILRDVSYGSSLWAGRIHNYWSFSKMLGYLETALSKLGIAAVRVGERGSSNECPCCASKRVVRRPRWVLRCRECGERIHSDQAGSRNILKFQKPSVGWAGAEAAPRTETRRWDAHGWRTRSAHPGWYVGDDVPEFLRAA